MATWAQGTAQPTQADVMASFSSRGPTGDWIKPDVTAPGVQVLAGMTPQPDRRPPTTARRATCSMAIAGTSMSSPHAAGVSALVKAAHPVWTPEEIKSALMTSSVQTVVKEDGVTPATPFDTGAGSIRADRAVNPTLVFNETYADFVAAGSDPLHRIDLNLAEHRRHDDARRDHDAADGDQRLRHGSRTLDVTIASRPGSTIIVGNNARRRTRQPPRRVEGRAITFPITIDAPAVAERPVLRLDHADPLAGGNAVFIPVAFVKKQGAVDADPTRARRRRSAYGDRRSRTAPRPSRTPGRRRTRA